MYLYELSKELSKLNCDVTVVAHNDNGPLAKIAKRLNIKLLKENEYPGFKMGDGKWILSTQDGPQPSQPNVFYKTSDVSFDIIHTQHYPITSKICTLYPTTPKVSTIHSEIIDLENPFIHDSIEDYIAIRPEIKEYLISNFGIPEDKIEIIYNPIDGSRFNESNTKDDGYVLFVGTIDFLRRRTIEDLVEYTKSINKELWVVGKRYSNDDYIVDILNNDHVKHFDDTYNVEKYVKNCYQTAGIQLGRTTIEGWLCGKSGWIYKVDFYGNIIEKSLNEPPLDKNKFISSEVAKKIKQKYIEILNK
jgi:glycosyltransferase involved in cell wall biosynthesis